MAVFYANLFWLKKSKIFVIGKFASLFLINFTAFIYYKLVDICISVNNIAIEIEEVISRSESTAIY